MVEQVVGARAELEYIPLAYRNLFGKLRVDVEISRPAETVRRDVAETVLRFRGRELRRVQASHVDVAAARAEHGGIQQIRQHRTAERRRKKSGNLAVGHAERT